VTELCASSTENSGPGTSNAVTTGQIVLVTVVCSGTSSFLVGGDDDPTITINAGDLLFMEIDSSCNSPPVRPVQITSGPGIGFLYNVGVAGNGISVGNLSIQTTASTPALLGYRCTTFVMGGYIFVTGGVVTPAVAPIAPLISQGSPACSSLVITWTPGTENDCVFAAWNVTNVATNGTLEGCLPSAMIDEEVTACTATDLDPNTSYSVIVTEVCENQNANSGPSPVSNSLSTLGTLPPTPTTYFWGLKGLPTRYALYYYIGIAVLAILLIAIVAWICHCCCRRKVKPVKSVMDRPDFGSDMELNG